MKQKKKLSSLDYLLIPTGWGRQRKKRALEEINSGRKVKNMIILNGNDSEEDILYLGKILKRKEKIGIVTFPLHFQEYKEIIKKAQKEKKFPKEIRVENIATQQTIKQFIYGLLGLAEERFDKRVNYAKNEHESHFKKKLKKFLKKILK